MKTDTSKPEQKLVDLKQRLDANVEQQTKLKDSLKPPTLDKLNAAQTQLRELDMKLTDALYRRREIEAVLTRSHTVGEVATPPKSPPRPLTIPNSEGRTVDHISVDR